MWNRPSAFDETALFLHRVVSDLPEEKRNMLDPLHRSFGTGFDIHAITAIQARSGPLVRRMVIGVVPPAPANTFVIRWSHGDPDATFLKHATRKLRNKFKFGVVDQWSYL
jgi:hypothetical protein